ncbi:hypothetical protein [Pseudoxanthomonas sp. SE1]|uniref:hypothetical protein n=1 Tax=Pseudoxanthomonas sp. SE1 TaxID=1664560 RepID=UPI00240E9630|nr:hypothetical protein [Pseudoxanthomonas sp. SE1]WFC40806.1 hypothetical protein OY559_13430 [Pseudoxanthomonas sp. SE1]
MSEDANDHDQKGNKSHKATWSGRSKPKKTLSKSEKARRAKNREKGYPAEVALKTPGPKRKFYLNDRHVDKQAVLDAARSSGDNSSIAKAELTISRSIIPAERFLEEPDLLGRAFVPYRYQSPWRRTENFAKKFDQVFREYEDRYFGKSIPAPSREALSLWPDSDIIALWRARRHADSLGMPYNFYIRTAFDYRFKTGYRRCPKPGQLWHGKKIIEHIAKEFETQGGNSALREYDPAVLDPMFLVENYRGDPIQRAAHDDLRLKAKMFPDFFKLSMMLKSSRIITEGAARQQFGDEAVDRVQDYTPHRMRELSVPPTEAQRPKPGCFGMHEPTATDCPTCPVRVECQVFQAQVDAIILAEYGSIDPVKAATTNAATLRKQRQRERERLDRKVAGSEGAGHAVEVESEMSSNEDRRPKP